VRAPVSGEKSGLDNGHFTGLADAIVGRKKLQAMMACSGGYNLVGWIAWEAVTKANTFSGYFWSQRKYLQQWMGSDTVESAF
jgi:hypothetical protein